MMLPAWFVLRRCCNIKCCAAGAGNVSACFAYMTMDEMCGEEISALAWRCCSSSNIIMLCLCSVWCVDCRVRVLCMPLCMLLAHCACLPALGRRASPFAIAVCKSEAEESVLRSVRARATTTPHTQHNQCALRLRLRETIRRMRTSKWDRDGANGPTFTVGGGLSFQRVCAHGAARFACGVVVVVV